jgi:hypothetical protein
VLCQGRFDAADKLSLSVAELHVCFLENERRPERPPTGRHGLEHGSRTGTDTDLTYLLAPIVIFKRANKQEALPP